jgi:hypothetical protein
MAVSALLAMAWADGQAPRFFTLLKRTPAMLTNRLLKADKRQDQDPSLSPLTVKGDCDAQR